MRAGELPVRGTRHLGLGALALTVVIGSVLRWTLAGAGWPSVLGSWTHVRSAHSHLGYYGVLFPLVWVAWARMGLHAPGRRTLAIYALATAAACIDFARHGYAPVSIAGSTVVLGTWCLTSLPTARFLVRRDWLAPVAPAVGLACGAIAGVAVLSARGDPLATPMVRAFLTWLLLGVVLATCLRSARAPAPPSWLHVPLVVGSGVALGPWPHPAARALLAAYGAMLVVTAVRMPGARAIRGAWGVLGGGFLVVALAGLGHHHLVAIAGIHFAVLGPVAASAAWPRAWAPALPVYTVAVGLFSLAIVGPLLLPWTGWSRASAGLGTAVAAVWVLRWLGAAWGRVAAAPEGVTP